jgi:aminomethyltransferase
MAERRYAASHAILSVSAKRFARSPFFECYATDEAIFGIYSGRLYPLSLGEDPVENYWALRRRAVLYEVPEHPIEIAGPDAVRLLDRVLTRNVAMLRVGRASYGIACYADGGIVMDGVLMRLADDRFWYVLADGEFMGWLAAQAAGLDVAIRDPHAWVLQVQGPRALDVLAAACDEGAPDPFSYFAVAECAIAGRRMIVSRTGWTGEMGFELYVPVEGGDGPALWRHLMAAGEAVGMIFSSLESMGVRRIEAGILDNGTDMDPSMTPFAAGLGQFVDMTKPGFIGREALARADRRPRLHGLRCATATPAAEDAVLLDGAPVGQMTTGAWSPFLEAGIGYARFDEPGDWPGARVTLATRDGATHVAEIAPLPFHDAEKRIPRGLADGVP